MPITKPAIAEPEAPLPGENPVSAGIGHNQPPPEEQVKIDFREGMIEKHPQFEQRIADLRAGADRAVVDTAEKAALAGDLVKQIRAMEGAVNDTHKTVKQPYLDAGRVADAEKNRLLADLTEAKNIITAKQTEFLRVEEAKREAARRAEEARARAEAEAAAEAERQRAAAEGQGDVAAMEAVEAVAAPVVIAKASEPIRSADTGVIVSGRKEWQSQVNDYTLAVIEVLDDEGVRQAVEKAVARRVKAGVRQIAGVHIWQATKAVTR